MRTIKYQAIFRKDLKKIQKRGYNLELMWQVIEILLEGKELPEHYRDHILSGQYKGCHECHISPDWLMIYKIIDNEVTLLMMRTGTHSDLF